MNEVIKPEQLEQPEELHQSKNIPSDSDNEIIIIKFNKEFTECIYTIYKSY